MPLEYARPQNKNLKKLNVLKPLIKAYHNDYKKYIKILKKSRDPVFRAAGHSDIFSYFT